MKETDYKYPALAGMKKEVRKAADGKQYAKAPIEKLTVAAARRNDSHRKIDHRVQCGMVDGARAVINMEELLERLKAPLDPAGKPVELHTREGYEIYKCLKIMPYCISSMEITQGGTETEIGTNRPLENTVCVAIGERILPGDPSRFRTA